MTPDRSRQISQPVERARIEALLDRSVSVPDASIAVARVLAGRRQKKVRGFELREQGRIVVDFEVLQREFAGELVRFQLREAGQVLGTAQWHIPPQPDGKATEEAAHPPPASSTPEVHRLREELASVRGELRRLDEEARRLREALQREQSARQRAEAGRHRAEAERDVAREGEQRQRKARESLRKRLHAADLERKESELAFRLLRERVPEELGAISRIVLGK